MESWTTWDTVTLRKVQALINNPVTTPGVLSFFTLLDGLLKGVPKFTQEVILIAQVYN